jgi:hypothetical protein
MVAVLPVGTLTALAQIVLSPRAPGDKLHAAGEYIIPVVLDQKMDVVGGDDVIEHAQPVTLPRFVQPAQIAAPVACEFEQERPVVAAVRDVPELARHMMAIRARHRGNPL